MAHQGNIPVFEQVSIDEPLCRGSAEENTLNHRFNKPKYSIHSVSPIIAIIFVALLFGLYGIVCLLDDILPTPLYLVDENSHKNSFIAERAQQDLKRLTDIGPRITGSPGNEDTTVQFFEDAITLIKQETDPNHKMEVDFQVVSGSYYLDFKPFGAINAYHAIQNIVIKLYSKNNSKHSLLVNAHFDSVPGSLGGSDDGINCVTMLEVLRKLSRSPEKFQHNVIFLFNGAEETPLQASHGFITQHKWAKEVRAVVNLDAAGAGGKEILFQAGPWLLKYYAKVPHPNGQAAGEELFQTGLIPSGTDFRIFRDFGQIVGVDLAFNRDGYRYHTKHDGFMNIPLGSYQHVGDNTLALIRSLANAPELLDPKGQGAGKMIFYDYFGLFMVTYSATVAIVINGITLLVSTVIAVKSFHHLGLGLNRHDLLYIGLTLGSILLGWIAAGLVVVIVALILDAVNFSMSWYNNTWIILGLYSVPVFNLSCGTIALLNYFYTKSNLTINAQAQIQVHLLRLLWSVPLLIGTIIGFRGVYLILIPLLFQTLTAGILQFPCMQKSIRKWKIIYILGTLIPNIFLMKQGREIFALLVPICGRIGSGKNPEVIIALLCTFLTILVTSYYTPLITLVRRPLLVFASLWIVFVIFFIIVFTPLGFPYSSNPNSPTPQRFWIHHMHRTFRNDENVIYKEDAGYFLLNMDRHSPYSVSKHVRLISKIESVKEDCKTSLMCGLPITTPRIVPILHDSSWIPAEQPRFLTNTSLILNSKTIFADSTTQFKFTASGPSHMTLYLSPRNNISLRSISLLHELPSKHSIWNGRPVYIIISTWGKESSALKFSINFQTPLDWKGPIFDIALTGTYKDEQLNEKTAGYDKFINEFPEWTDVTAWLGSYESWVY